MITVVPRLALFVLVLFTAISLRAQSENSSAAHWQFRDQAVRDLVSHIPEILKTQDPATGQWGNKNAIWIVTDQHPMWPLAVAYTSQHPENPYHRDPALLAAITAAGDALIADLGKDGHWEFRKKDGSTWGPIRMPWTYTRWMRTYQLIRDQMPPQKREEWVKALTNGYTNIAKHDMDHLHNIPVFHAVGLYAAGQVFDRPEWREQASEMMRRVVETQTDGGFWSENHGPVVGYGSVYVEALGIYYTMSKDETVLPAIDRAATFFSEFTYPDGSSVSDIDERQTYKSSIATPPSTFFLTTAGRTYARRQLALQKERKTDSRPGADTLASVVMGGIEGPAEPPGDRTAPRSYVMPDGKALMKRDGNWAVCYSAYACPVPDKRWIQDRQNLVGLFHKEKGLLMGGGNTKLQPLWSTFTVGDTARMKHKEGDKNPDFSPRPGLLYVPTSGGIVADSTRLDLAYGSVTAHVVAQFHTPATARITYAVDQSSTLSVQAHMPLLPRIGKPWATAAGKSGRLTSDTLNLASNEIGEWFELDGVRYTLPKDSTVTWPVLMHNPYAKFGETTPALGGRLTIIIPFGLATGEKHVHISIKENKPANPT